MIEYECPECGELIESPDELEGLEDTCENCLNRISVPDQNNLNSLQENDEYEDGEWEDSDESLSVASGDSVEDDSYGAKNTIVTKEMANKAKENIKCELDRIMSDNKGKEFHSNHHFCCYFQFWCSRWNKIGHTKIPENS